MDSEATVRRFALPLLLLFVVFGSAAWLLATREPEVAPVAACEEQTSPAASPSLAGRKTEAAAKSAREEASLEKTVAARGSGPVAAPDPEIESTGPFSGVVVDTKDAPVAGATVRVVSGWGREGGLSVEGIPAATTGSNGRFAFTAPKAVREVRVGARAAGLAPARPDVAVRAGSDAHVVMVAACALRVRVVREGSDAGVAGVRVLAFGGSNPEWTEWARQADARLALEEGRTDSAGLVTLSTPGGRVALVATADDGSSGRLDGLLVPAAGMDATLALRAVGKIAAEVVDPAGAPVAGARVTAVGDAGYARETKTAADGSFTLEGVRASASPAPEDRTEVTIAAAGWPPRRISLDAPAPGEIHRIRIVLPAWWRIEGKVLRQDGSPAAGARVVSADRPLAPDDEALPEARLVATAGADDSFSVDTLPADPQRRAYLFASLDEPAGHSAASLVLWSTIPAGQPVLLKLSAPSPSPKGTIRIRVVDAEGRAVPDTLVEAGVMHEAYSLLGTFHATTTDADGRARIENLAAGRILLVVHPRTAPTVAIPLDGSGGDGEREVKLTDGMVWGRVLNVDGTPAEIDLRLELLLQSSGGVETQFGGWGRTRTNHEGIFEYRGVGAGNYRLVPDSPAYTWVGRVRNVQAPATDLSLVVATAADEALLHLEGEWVDADTNAPVQAPEVTVLLSTSAASGAPLAVRLTAVPGMSGVWRSVDSVVPGAYEATVRMWGYREAKAFGVRVPDGAHMARIRQRLEPAGRVEGTVLASDGKALPGRVEVKVGDRTTVVRADGGYALAVPREGDVEVSVGGDHVRAALKRASVPREGAARVDFVVERGGALLVRLPEGLVPKERVIVHVTRIDLAPGEGTYMTGVDIGPAWLAAHPPSRVVPGLPPGRYRITPFWDGAPLDAADTVIREGETTTFDVRAP